MKYERIPTDAPIKHVWNRLDILTTITGATKFLNTRAEEQNLVLEPGVLNNKARGLAFAIRTAKEYFNIKIEGNLTSASLSYYYGALSLLKALLIADVNNKITLDEIENFTQYGHGLRLVMSPSEQEMFPESEYLMVLNNGFFNQYLKESGYNLKDIAVSKAVKFNRKDSPEDLSKIFSVKEIISRIPELKGIYSELFKEQPNYISFDVQNTIDPGKKHLRFSFNYNTEFMNIENISQILNVNPGLFETIEEYEESLIKTIEPMSSETIKLQYKSVLSNDSYIRPLNGIEDKILFDFILLYTLSIWVRYRPALWREVTEGELDIFRPLITNFLLQIERVFPNIILNRLYNKNFLFAGFSYL